MRRRRALVTAGSVILLAAAATTSVALARRDDGEAGSTTPDTSVATSFATAERRDLTQRTDLDGMVGHGESDPLSLAGQGTITRLPEIGTVVGFGEVLAEVDGSPVLLLEGDRPAWRALDARSDDGEDIRQLEASLVALGYASADEVEVDDEWDSATTAAVKRLQQWWSMPVDGRIDLGEVVFRPERVRIAVVEGHLGDAASAAGISVTALDQRVTTSIDATDADLLDVGDTVIVELPTGDEIDATVAETGAPVVDGEGNATVPVTLDAGELDLDDGVPVEIHVDVVDVADALTVPAEALLALAEGGYAVEVPDTSSPTGTRLVAVEVGAFADGWVQIDGDIAEGDQVVVP